MIKGFNQRDIDGMVSEYYWESDYDQDEIGEQAAEELQEHLPPCECGNLITIEYLSESISFEGHCDACDWTLEADTTDALENAIKYRGE